MFANVSSEIRGGFFRWKRQYMENIPIPKGLQYSLVGQLSQEVSEKKSAMKTTDTTPLESQIDLLVYHLYELTYEEVLLVDPAFELTEEEYNNAKP